MRDQLREFVLLLGLHFRCVAPERIDSDLGDLRVALLWLRVPGTTITCDGVTEPKHRADLIAYLKGANQSAGKQEPCDSFACSVGTHGEVHLIHVPAALHHADQRRGRARGEAVLADGLRLLAGLDHRSTPTRARARRATR